MLTRANLSKKKGSFLGGNLVIYLLNSILWQQFYFFILFNRYFFPYIAQYSYDKPENVQKTKSQVVNYGFI